MGVSSGHGKENVGSVDDAMILFVAIERNDNCGGKFGGEVKALVQMESHGEIIVTVHADFPQW